MRQARHKSLFINLLYSDTAKKDFKYFTLSILAALGILGFVLVANLNAEHILSISLKYPGIDKTAHFLFHLALVTSLYILSRNLWRQQNNHRRLLAAFLLSLLIGISDELQQLFVASRDFDFYDFLANLGGALTAAIFIAVHNTKKILPALLLAIPLAIMWLSIQHTMNTSRYYNAGLVHIKHKNYSAAQQAFLTGIEHGENLPALFNELAWIELEYLHTDPKASLSYTRRAISAQPNNASFLDTHGWALFMNGDYPQALNYLLKSYQSDNKIYCINFHLGATYFALGMHQQSLPYLQGQLALNNRDRFAQKSRELLEKIRKGNKSLANNFALIKK